MYLLLLFLCVSSAVGQVIMDGVCDRSIEHIRINPKISPFLGRWYMNKNLGHSRDVGMCPGAVVRRHPGEVDMSGWLVDSLFIEDHKAYIFSRKQFSTFTGGINANSLLYSTKTSPRVNYHVLDTDFATFLVLYSCTQTTPHSKTVTAQLYTTNGRMAFEGFKRLDSLIKRYPELQDHWTTFNQAHCDLHFDDHDKE